MSEQEGAAGAPGEVAAAPALDATRLAAARLAAVRQAPYLASALFAAAVLPAPRSGTVAVDRAWRVQADPEVAGALPAAELGRLLVHLVAHLLRDHAGRAGALGGEGAGTPAAGGGRAAWNRAADAEVNDDLVTVGLVPDSAPELPGDLGQPAGRLAEQYYPHADAGSRRWDCGSGCDGIDRPWDGGGEVRGEAGLGERRAEWLRLVTAAELHRCESAEPGSVPTGWLRWAERVLPSKVDWRRLLAAEIRGGIVGALGMVDYRYSRSSRRAGSCPDVVLPVLERPLPELAIVCDTSGSMGPDLLAAALAEVEAIIRRAGLEQSAVPVIACDAAVHAVRRVRRASEVLLAGGGGTDMSAGIAKAAALRPRPSIVVVLTDGHTPWPAVGPPGVRVVAGLLGSRRWAHAGPRRPPDWVRAVQIEP